MMLRLETVPGLSCFLTLLAGGDHGQHLPTLSITHKTVFYLNLGDLIKSE